MKIKKIAVMTAFVILIVAAKVWACSVPGCCPPTSTWDDSTKSCVPFPPEWIPCTGNVVTHCTNP